MISPRVGEVGDQAQEVLAARAAVELVELVGALGRVRPRPVQAAALAGEGEELRPVLARQHAQTDPRARRRRRRLDLGGAEGFVGAAAEHWPFHAWSIKAHARIEWRAMRVLAPVVLIVLLAAGCGVSSY